MAQTAVDRIAGVKPIKAKLDAMQARFVVRSLGNPAAMEGLWPADFEGHKKKGEWKGIRQTTKITDVQQEQMVLRRGRPHGGKA